MSNPEDILVLLQRSLESVTAMVAYTPNLFLPSQPGYNPKPIVIHAD